MRVGKVERRTTYSFGRSELLSYSTGAILALHWRTLHRTIRTKDATIAGFGAEQRLTANAFVEELAGLSWHRFAFGEAANRTYQHGFQNKLAHTRLSLSGRPLRAVMHKPHQRTLAGIRLTVRPGRGGFSATSRSISKISSNVIAQASTPLDGPSTRRTPLTRKS